MPDLELELDEKEARKAKETEETEVPKGYLSLEEIAENYPTFAREVEGSVRLDQYGKEKEGMRVMVYLNEPVPLKALLRSKQRDEIIPNKKEMSMLATDVLFLIGDPNYRYDQEEPPEGANMQTNIFYNDRTQLIDYCKRNPKYRGEGEKMARYKESDTIPINGKEMPVIKVNDKYNLWNKIPDFRIAVAAHLTEAIAPKVSHLERVWNAMQKLDIKPSKSYKKEQIIAVAEQLLLDSHIYGDEDKLRGKNSHRHIELDMEDATERYSKKPV